MHCECEYIVYVALFLQMIEIIGCGNVWTFDRMVLWSNGAIGEQQQQQEKKNQQQQQHNIQNNRRK